MTNLFLENQFRPVLKEMFKKRRFDEIPAICDGTEGFCIVSMTPEEIQKICASISRGVKVNATGQMTAKIMGTDIYIDVCSIHALTDIP